MPDDKKVWHLPAAAHSVPQRIKAQVAAGEVVEKGKYSKFPDEKEKPAYGVHNPGFGAYAPVTGGVHNPVFRYSDQPPKRIVKALIIHELIKADVKRYAEEDAADLMARNMAKVQPQQHKQMQEWVDQGKVSPEGRLLKKERGIPAGWAGKSATCPKCQKEVKTTHPMQTLYAQMHGHLRTHGMSHAEARKLNPVSKY